MTTLLDPVHYPWPRPNDGKLIGWDVATGSPIWTADTKENKIYDAVYTPDGRRIVTSHQAKIKVWDAATGRLVYAWNAHGPESPILSIDLAPDGRNLLSTASDGTFKLWPTFAAQ